MWSTSLFFLHCIGLQSCLGLGGPNTLEQDLQAVINSSKLFGITLAVALPNRSVITVVSGHSSILPPKHVNTTDKFLWGSATKMYTAAAVLRLVDKQRFSLDDAALPLLDSLFIKINGTSLEAYFGPGLRNVTVRQLLGMSAGIADFDLRSRSYQLAHPTDDLGPVQNIGFANRTIQYPPGTKVAYSSTNYELLGLILAQAAGATSWDTYDQATGFPADLMAEMPHTAFGVHGTCKKYGTVHGLCTERVIKDTYFMSCTNGWTCGNLLSNGADAATFARALLGNEERVLKKETLQQMQKMRPITFGWGKSRLYYGLGLMDMSMMVGEPAGSLAFVGHGGETYGFNSFVGYLRSADAGVAIASNNELGLSGRDLWKVVRTIKHHVGLDTAAQETEAILV